MAFDHQNVVYLLIGQCGCCAETKQSSCTCSRRYQRRTDFLSYIARESSHSISRVTNAYASITLWQQHRISSGCAGTILDSDSEAEAATRRQGARLCLSPSLSTARTSLSQSATARPTDAQRLRMRIAMCSHGDLQFPDGQRTMPRRARGGSWVQRRSGADVGRASLLGRAGLGCLGW